MKVTLLEEFLSKNEDIVYLIDILRKLESVESFDDFQDFLKKFDMTEDELGLVALRLLHSFFAQGRSSVYNGSYDGKQLIRGMEVEMEHTSCPIISMKISMDHLAELPDYYTRLDNMEREAETEGV